MKAARLQQLLDLGLRVPPFVVVAPGDPTGQVSTFVSEHAGPFAVRSSADVEDGHVASFAGIFDTYLSVPADAVERHIELVRRSVHGARALEYATHVGKTPRTMHVVVQQMANCKVAGVALSRHPARASRQIAIQACWGWGETVVAELAETDEFEIDPATGAVTRARVGRQIQQIVDTPAGPRVEPVPYLEQCRRKLAPSQIAAIRDCVEFVRARLQIEIDLEWGFDSEGILVLQARPLTHV